MKKPGFILALFLCLIVSAASAQDYKTALGVRLSSSDAIVNHSISFKYFFSQTAAEVLISLGDPVALGLLLEKHKPFGPQGLAWFYGGGAYAGFGDGKYFGIHGIVGLDYKWPGVPINISLDWKPELNIISDIIFESAAIAFSARFTFN